MKNGNPTPVKGYSTGQSEQQEEHTFCVKTNFDPIESDKGLEPVVDRSSDKKQRGPRIMNLAYWYDALSKKAKDH